MSNALKDILDRYCKTSILHHVDLFLHVRRGWEKKQATSEYDIVNGNARPVVMSANNPRLTFRLSNVDTG
jgi:hypothetical protein